MNGAAERLGSRRMRRGLWWGWVATTVLVSLFRFPAATAQTFGTRYEARGSIASSVSGEVRRELIDPCLGSRWQLVVDPGHPQWPARLILVDPGYGGVPISASGAASPAQPAAILAGDRVTVDQQTPVLHARLQAVALESAAVGQRIRVRLSQGADSARGLYGRVITVTAAGAGETQWRTQ